MNQPERPKGSLFDLFSTPEGDALPGDAERLFGKDSGKRAVSWSRGTASPTDPTTSALLHVHGITVRTSEEYETPAKRHLRLLDASAPTGKAGKAARRFLAQQRAAYARADAALLRKVEAEVLASTRAKLRALEESLLRGDDGASRASQAGDAVAEGGQGADRQAAGPGRRRPDDPRARR